MIHEMCSVTLDLLIGSHRAKNYLCEALTGKHAEADTTNWTAVLDQGQCFMLGIKNKPEIKDY